MARIISIKDFRDAVAEYETEQLNEELHDISNEELERIMASAEHRMVMSEVTQIIGQKVERK